MSQTSYKNSSHYLHRAYMVGYNACLSDDDFCPYAQNSPEWNWFQEGWGEAASNA